MKKLRSCKSVLKISFELALAINFIPPLTFNFNDQHMNSLIYIITHCRRSRHLRCNLMTFLVYKNLRLSISLERNLLTLDKNEELCRFVTSSCCKVPKEILSAITQMSALHYRQAPATVFIPFPPHSFQCKFFVSLFSKSSLALVISR